MQQKEERLVFLFTTNIDFFFFILLVLLLLLFIFISLARDHLCVCVVCARNAVSWRLCMYSGSYDRPNVVVVVVVDDAQVEPPIRILYT